MSTNVAFAPQLPEFREDPQAVYNRLRALGPIFENGDGTWVAVSHKACSAILADPARVIKASEARLAHMGPGRFHDYCKNTMAFMERPDHPRVRAAVAPTFLPGAVSRMTENIRELCDELLQPLVGRSSFDFIREFAGPFPLYVICDLLGIPREHWELFRKGAHEITIALEPMATAEQIDEANRSCTELSEVITQYVQRSNDQADKDLVNILKSQFSDSAISWDEFINQVIFLLAAGHETTTTLLSYCMKSLIELPDVAEALRNDAALAGNVVSEVLRLHPPLQFVLRKTLEAIEVEGAHIAKGAMIFVLIGAANRDPALFPNPDVLDVHRGNAARHLAFASGPHTCLGNNLARLEGRIAVEGILKSLPSFRFEETPTPSENFVFQGFLTMPLEQRSLMAAC